MNICPNCGAMSPVEPAVQEVLLEPTHITVVGKCIPRVAKDAVYKYFVVSVTNRLSPGPGSWVEREVIEALITDGVRVVVRAPNSLTRGGPL